MILKVDQNLKRHKTINKKLVSAGQYRSTEKVMNNFCEVFENIKYFCYELFGHFRTFTSKSSFEPVISRVGRGGGVPRPYWFEH